MTMHSPPFVLAAALVGAASPVFAGGADALALAPEPVRAEVVDSETLSQIRGKYYGADMLVGLRIELQSQWRTPDGSLAASGTLQIQRQADGSLAVHIDTRSQAQPGGALGSAGSTGSASGAEAIRVDGIGQIVQVAGDGNQFSNGTTISFVPGQLVGADLNGRASSQSSHGALQAKVSFDGQGLSLALHSADGQMEQSLHNGVMQSARIAGNDQVGSNIMRMQVMTERMGTQALATTGVAQALAALAQLPRSTGQ